MEEAFLSYKPLYLIIRLIELANLVQCSFMVFISLDEKKEVLKLLKFYLSPYEKIAIACSGGPDSIYLLHVLIDLQKIFFLK